MTTVTIKSGRDTTETQLTGKITYLYYSSDSFSAGIIRADHGPVWDRECKFAIRANVRLNEDVILTGKWGSHPKYGEQFQAESLSYPMPEISDSTGLAEYLADNPAFANIGPAKAKLIADYFGSDFDKAIREEPELVARIGKLSDATVNTLQEQWILRADLNSISTWLAGYGLTHNQIRRIAEKYGNRAKQVLTDNPYILCDEIDGFGFTRTDEIAMKLGIPKDHAGRIRTCLCYEVRTDSEAGGHTYIPKSELVRRATGKLACDTLDQDAEVRRLLDRICADGAPLVCVGENVALSFLYEREMEIAEILLRAGKEKVNLCSFENLPNLSELQNMAVRMALTSRLSVLTGGAGTGKSSCISSIYRTCKMANLNIALAAPTGKAAKLLASRTGDASACTLHRLLAYNPGQGGFTFNSANKLPHDIVIIDEVSMCDISILHALLTAINWDRTTVLFVGDHNQLPPIGTGNVLRDILDHRLVPITILDKCFRQAGVLRYNCNSILTGVLPRSSTAIPGTNSRREWHVQDSFEDPERLLDAIRYLYITYLEKWGYEPLTDCQIITPQNKGPLGVNRLNLELQKLWQELRYGRSLPSITPSDYDKRAPQFYPGDKVMQIKNDYQLDIMNGTIGYVDAVRTEKSENGKQTVYSICFEDSASAKDNALGEPVEITAGSDQARNVVLAYACTIHKVQGSEYPCVISIIHKAHTYTLSRNLIYTAATRARETAIIIGDRLGMRRGLANTTVANRRTWLSLSSQGA